MEIKMNLPIKEKIFIILSKLFKWLRGGVREPKNKPKDFYPYEVGDRVYYLGHKWRVYKVEGYYSSGVMRQVISITSETVGVQIATVSNTLVKPLVECNSHQYFILRNNFNRNIFGANF